MLAVLHALNVFKSPRRLEAENLFFVSTRHCLETRAVSSSAFGSDRAPLDPTFWRSLLGAAQLVTVLRWHRAGPHDVLVFKRSAIAFCQSVGGELWS